MPQTSWDRVHEWYERIVDQEGHYYHKTIIIPRTLQMLVLSEQSSVIDFGCGQGVFSRYLPPEVSYVGLDIGKALIKQAKKNRRYPHHHFLQKDVTQPLGKLPQKNFSHAIFLLSLQNMRYADLALQNASYSMQKGGLLLLVLNHPCFRIPKHSSWIIEHSEYKQARRVDAYNSSLTIPIAMHPSQKERGAKTFSFHYSLATLFDYLKGAHFVTLSLEEWSSNKKSTGKYARMEDRARKEFPLFLALLCRKETGKLIE